jgi:hypothetical protein
VLPDRLFEAASTILAREATGTAFRLIGIGAIPLLPLAGADRSDLADLETPHRAATHAAIDALRQRFGEAAIGRGRRWPVARGARKGRGIRLKLLLLLRLGRGRCDRDLARLWLITGARRTLFPFFGLARWLASFLTIIGPSRGGLLLAVLLVLLRRLVHCIQDTEIMLGVLKIALRHHSVAAAGRIAAELEILFEQLLRRSADPKVGAAAVENVIAIERDVATATSAMMSQSAASTPAATGSMAASTHAFHVHIDAIEPSLLRTGSCRDTRGDPQTSRGMPPRPGFNPTTLVPASTPTIGPGRLGRAAVRLALPG